MKELLELFFVFAKIAAFTFGGGYAMMPLLQRELVQRRGWATEEQLVEYYAIAQCTPGIVAVNTATFVGYTRKGDLGGVVATLGLLLPSLILMSLAAGLFHSFADIPAVQHAFAGIRICVLGLVLNTVITLWKASVVDAIALLIFGAVFALTFFFGASSALLVLCAGGLGCAVKLGVRRVKSGE